MKKIKVFWLGKHLRDIYPHATKFQVFKFRVIKFIRKIVYILVIAILTYIFISIYFPKYREVKIEKIIEVDNLSLKVDQLKNELLDKLRECESNGATEEDGLIVFDSNKVASIGLYQFQKKTVIHYNKSLYNKDITGLEAIKIALDENESRKLASDIIFNDSKGIDNWYNCKLKKNLTEDLKIINKLK